MGEKDSNLFDSLEFDANGLIPAIAQDADTGEVLMLAYMDREALRLNSANHGRRGQNVIFGDGHARHLRTRFLDGSRDDIYTMEDDAVGGCKKLPACLDDAFLAP